MAAAAFALALPAEAAPGIPVRIRVLKASRQGPAAVDPRLSDLQPQLSRLAYLRWEEVGEQRADMDFKVPLDVPLPSGDRMQILILESRKDTVTFEVRVPEQKTQSKLTISKDKRIVHQVTPERAARRIS
jgi:hypothetical protein